MANSNKKSISIQSHHRNHSTMQKKRNLKNYSPNKVSWNINISPISNQQPNNVNRQKKNDYHMNKNQSKKNKLSQYNSHNSVKNNNCNIKRTNSIINSSSASSSSSSSESFNSSIHLSSETLEQRFIDSGGTIVKSSQEEWNKFYENKPKVIGVDTEGIHHVPPLLVQIAYRNKVNGKIIVILEAPRKGILSSNMLKILSDSSITKVFCDASGDTEALGTQVNQICDIQEMATNQFETSNKLGLGNLGSKFVFNNENVIKNKKGWKYFTYHKYRPSNQSWPSLSQHTSLCYYAAADAWMTLEIYDAMKKKIKMTLLSSQSSTFYNNETDDEEKQGYSYVIIKPEEEEANVVDDHHKMLLDEDLQIPVFERLKEERTPASSKRKTKVFGRMKNQNKSLNKNSSYDRSSYQRY
mmetsp:Transcript_46878/g.60248  ORF Transcript_46878/g.60248 Transcript_46878/m.60248 type:complete len:411 (+) Transcript_46878:15-1247(+)